MRRLSLSLSLCVCYATFIFGNVFTKIMFRLNSTSPRERNVAELDGQKKGFCFCFSFYFILLYFILKFLGCLGPLLGCGFFSRSAPGDQRVVPALRTCRIGSVFFSLSLSLCVCVCVCVGSFLLMNRRTISICEISATNATSLTVVIPTNASAESWSRT